MVENMMAAQSGMMRWMTSGRDSRTMAFPTRRVTRKRWWSEMTFNILSPICLVCGSGLFCMISRLSMLSELSPTVMPEQNPPASAKTEYLSFYRRLGVRSTRILVCLVWDNVVHTILILVYLFSFCCFCSCFLCSVCVFLRRLRWGVRGAVEWLFFLSWTAGICLKVVFNIN